MNSYPKNRKYLIIPRGKVKQILGKDEFKAKEDNDKGKVIWDFDEKDKRLKEFEKLEGVEVFNHGDAMKEMQKKKWKKKDSLISATV